MKLLFKRYSKKSIHQLGSVALVLMATVPPALAVENCADALHGASPVGSDSAKVSSDCPGYGQCIALGQQLLKDGNSSLAIEAFSKALVAAGDDQDLQGNAYGCLGVGYEANADQAEAQAHLEKAMAVSGRKLAWVETEYKHLLSSRTITTAEYMERKLNADKKIQEAEQARKPMQTKEEVLQTAATPNEESLPTTTTDPNSDAPTAHKTRGRGFVIDKEKMKMASSEEPERSKPQAQMAKSRPAPRPDMAARPGNAKKHNAPSPKAGEIPGVESFDNLRINFELRSAELTDEGKAQADELGKFLEKRLQDGRYQALLVGHTDLSGSPEFNQQLSEDRATTVKNYLTSAFPDLMGKLSEKGMGMTQPLYRDEDSQKLNRRVDIKLIPLAQQ